MLGAPHAGVYGSGRSTNAYCAYCVSDAVLTLSRASSKADWKPQPSWAYLRVGRGVVSSPQSCKLGPFSLPGQTGPQCRCESPGGGPRPAQLCGSTCEGPGLPGAWGHWLRRWWQLLIFSYRNTLDTICGLRQPALDASFPRPHPAVLRTEGSTSQNPPNPFLPCAWEAQEFSSLPSTSSSLPWPAVLYLWEGHLHLIWESPWLLSAPQPGSLNWLPDPLDSTSFLFASPSGPPQTPVTHPPHVHTLTLPSCRETAAWAEGPFGTSGLLPVFWPSIAAGPSAGLCPHILTS